MIYKLEGEFKTTNGSGKQILKTGTLDTLTKLLGIFVSEYQDTFDCHRVKVYTLDYAVLEGDNFSYTFVISPYWLRLINTKGFSFFPFVFDRAELLLPDLSIISLYGLIFLKNFIQTTWHILKFMVK